MQHHEVLDGIRAALGRVIHGKAEVIDRIIVGVVAGGHVLVEDVQGVGKTTLAKALARVFRMTCTRVQFTPDLLPSDILGTQILDPRDGSLTFRPGPVFTQVLIADEINRASPRTQSALLEAMNESTVTVDGVSHALPRPFFVLATQNPAAYQGAYPLPEAQLDRFLLRLSVGYPPPDAELAMLVARQRRDPLDDLAPIADAPTLIALQAGSREIEVREPVARYMLRLVAATREQKDLAVGVSPRGTLALFRASQAHAMLAGRAYVSPEDVQSMAVPVLAHRMQLDPQSRYAGTSTESILAGIVSRIDVPA
ncbi:MAG: MoxR family ATPase [Deltaproteobacteria bacterium]